MFNLELFGVKIHVTNFLGYYSPPPPMSNRVKRDFSLIFVHGGGCAVDCQGFVQVIVISKHKSAVLQK